jgi:hypothetical protein
VNSEPRPNSPSKGSGEAVWGSFCPLAFWSLEAAFWSAVLLAALLPEEAFWSAVALWPALVLLEAAFWSVLLGVVALAGGFCAVLVLEAAAFWSAVVLLVLEAEFWSVVLLEAGGLTGALALFDCAPAGLFVVAAG